MIFVPYEGFFHKEGFLGMNFAKIALSSHLREMMAGEGSNLSEVNSNQHQSSQQDSQNPAKKQDSNEKQSLVQPLVNKSAKGLIDYFA